MNDESRVISLRPKPKPEVTPPFIPPSEERRPRRRPGARYSLAYLVIAVLLAGGVYAWFSRDGDQSNDRKSAETGNAEEVQEEIEDLVTRVGKLIMLPEDEEPTIATVTDPAKLRDQVFFTNAKEGNIVLIYTKAQKAYLYDPEKNILVEVAPLTIQ